MDTTKEPVADGTSTPVAEPTAVTPPVTPAATSDNRMLFGILAYVGLLVIIPFLVAKDDTFVHFHVKQGLVLAGIWLVLFALGQMVYPLWPLISLVNLGIFALSIVGIVHVVQGKETTLPLVGHWADKIKL